MLEFIRREGGQSMVELALTLPLLVFALVGGADLARAFALQIAVENGSRAGAESYAIDSTPTNSEAQSAVVNEINRTPTANATASNVTVTKAQADGITACISPPTVATPCFVSVRVQYDWSTIIAWPIVPNGGTFDRTTTMRTFY
ncbi:MAG: pilus assembly protein [Chloroflexota bacterium]|nr:pilus assembly protein [Chloroflexota bacterium]